MRRASALLVAAMFGLAACSGEDGAAGPPGQVGPTGPTGPTGPSGPQGEPPQATLEECAGCHAGSLASKHALSDQLGVEVTVPANAIVQKLDAGGLPTADVTVTFNVKVNGVARFDFNRSASVARNHNEDATWVYQTNPTYTQVAPNNTGPAGVRTKLPLGSWTIATYQNGNVVVTIPNFVTTYGLVAGQAIMLNVMNPDGVTATAVATYGTPTHDVVGDQACKNCHGALVWREAAHDVTFPQGVGPCIVCHNRVGSADPRLPGAGTGLMGIVHGVHNSHNMPDGTYTFTWTNGNAFNFSIGFPGYMNNCSTCHDSTARLAQVMAAPVSYELCISCHDSFASFASAPASHDAFTPIGPWAGQTSCTVCHSETVADFHNGQKTERNGLIWDGADQSVVEGAKFALAVTGVSRVGTDYKVTWTATYNGAAVDPCNTDFAVGPVFLGVTADAATGKSGSNMQFIKAYGQGDDWVNAGRTGSVSPGQPATSATLAAANTTCAANVATTTTPVDTFVAAGTKGTMALQGKPQLRFAPAAGTSGEFIQARAVSPTYNFIVPAADGAATAGAARRTIVDTAKCLDCHLGTLYQHGGNRVDSVDLCVTCHNPAANETNVRVGYGVTAAEAYDGKPGEAYDMRNMIHGIHSAGESNRPLVIYRTRGIYFFGSQAALDASVAAGNWPSTGGVTCTNAEGAEVTYFKIKGSIASGNVPEANPDGTCKTTGLVASADGTWQTHNVVLVHYPQPLNNCFACHADSWTPSTVDPTKGVAMTVDAGIDPATWGNQLDDVLMGPTAASCLSCHGSGDPAVEFGLQVHAYGNGWIPTTFPDGRQTLIDAAGAW